MPIVIARNWWSLIVRGVVAILLGLVTFVFPSITLFGLVILFGAYALMDGVVSIIGAWRSSRAHERWGALVLEGVTGIAAAAVAALWPGITVLALVWVIGAWALITGALEIAAAVRLRQHLSGEWLLVLSGIASIVFGIFAISLPLVGAVAIAITFGIYAVIFGALLIGLGFRLRNWSKTGPSGVTVPLPAH